MKSFSFRLGCPGTWFSSPADEAAPLSFGIPRRLRHLLGCIGLGLLACIAAAGAGETASPEIVLPTPAGAQPPKGTVAFLVRFRESIRSDPNRSEADIQASMIRLLDTPLFSIFIRPQREFVAIVPVIRRAPPLQPTPVDSKILRIALSQLKGGQWYHMAFSWDAAAHQLVFFLNGVPQESAALVDVPFWREGVPDLQGAVRVGAPESGVDIRDARFLPESYGSRLPELFAADLAVVAPLTGEGRTLYAGALDLSGYQRTLLYDDNFRGPLDLVRETDLFEKDRRVREPSARWVLEGNGKASTDSGALILETNLFGPPPRWDGEDVIWTPTSDLVLWLNQTVPDGFLVEYTMEPSDSHRGLHILFFSAHGPDAKSIFAPGRRKREGKFSNYTLNPEEILSYHISFWGSPYTRRGTSNLRKNGDFILLSVGDDRIADRGQRPYQIRVLKEGGRIRAEVDGLTIIDACDNGKDTGPIFGGGLLGFRMMGDARSIKIRDLKIWKIDSP